MKKLRQIISVAAALACCAAATGCGVKTDRTVHDADEENAVALLTLYATGERGKVAPLLDAEGHAYAFVENLSASTITLGKGYELPAGSGVTVASWEFDAHGGIWYNIEPTYINQGWFVKRKSITRAVDADGLSRMNEFLTDAQNDKWTVFQNCTHFAVGLWNAVADGSGDEIDTKGMLTPTQLEKQVKRFEECEVGRPHVSLQPIGYYSGDQFVEFKLIK